MEKKEFEIFIIIVVWQVWSSKNGLLHNNSCPNAKKLVSWADGYLCEFKDAYVKKINNSGDGSVARRAASKN